MTDDHTTPRSRPSRRAVLAAGAAASVGAIVGRPSASATTAAADGASDRPTAARALMFPYQTTPGGRFSIVESGVDWQPGGVDPSYRTHVIAYDHARSMRAFLFADEDAPLDREGTFAIEPGPLGRQSRSGRRLLEVDVRLDS